MSASVALDATPTFRPPVEGILRLSHAEVRVPDLEMAIAYYTEVVGLIEVDRTDDRSYLKAWDELNHHSLVLVAARTYGLDALAFKVMDLGELERLALRVEAAGVNVTRHAPGELGIGSGTIVRFTAPSGHVVDLEQGQLQVGSSLPLLNPPPKPDGLKGMAPPRIDHIFLMCEDVDGITNFFRDVLEFRMTEQIVADDGHLIASFLERSHTAHDIAFITGPNGAFHHLAYWVDDWNELRMGADICAYHGVNVDVAPTRHGATRGCGLYFFDPAGNRNELFTGGYQFDPDDEPTTWTEAEMGRAIFSYRGRVDQKFMSVHS
jgi:catechol 2,3-dioxygenase